MNFQIAWQSFCVSSIHYCKVGNLPLFEKHKFKLNNFNHWNYKIIQNYLISLFYPVLPVTTDNLNLYFDKWDEKFTAKFTDWMNIILYKLYTISTGEVIFMIELNIIWRYCTITINFVILCMWSTMSYDYSMKQNVIFSHFLFNLESKISMFPSELLDILPISYNINNSVVMDEYLQKMGKNRHNKGIWKDLDMRKEDDFCKHNNLFFRYVWQLRHSIITIHTWSRLYIELYYILSNSPAWWLWCKYFHY